jgi:hypothetical protein
VNAAGAPRSGAERGAWKPGYVQSPLLDDPAYHAGLEQLDSDYLQRNRLQDIVLRSWLPALATSRTPLTLLTEAQTLRIHELGRLVA